MTQNDSPWEVLSSRQLFDSPFLKAWSERIRLPDGTIVADYYLLGDRNWAGIVPVTEEGKILLNRQYRHGVKRELLEFPAGSLDGHDEDPLDAAIRELMEETGYSTDREQFELLSHMVAEPSREETNIWWYLARNVRKTGSQKLDPVETIENILVTPQELLELIHNGQFLIQGQIAAAYQALERLGYLQVVNIL